MISIMHFLDYSHSYLRRKCQEACICSTPAKGTKAVSPGVCYNCASLHPPYIYIYIIYIYIIYIYLYIMILQLQQGLSSMLGGAAFSFRQDLHLPVLPKTIKNRDPDHIQRWDFQVLLLQFDLVSSHHSMSAETKVMMWARLPRHGHQ